MTFDEIPDDASEDLPPMGSAPGAVVPAPPDPDGDHRRQMDREKFGFAKWLLALTIVGALLLYLVEYLYPQDGVSLAGAIDMLKLLATTALGFVFGRALNRAGD